MHLHFDLYESKEIILIFVLLKHQVMRGEETFIVISLLYTTVEN